MVGPSERIGWAIVNQTNIGTASKATFWKLVRVEVYVELIWVFASALNNVPARAELLGTEVTITKTK